MNQSMKAFFIVLILGFLSGPSSTVAGELKCDADNGAIQLPKDFCALVVADDLGRARHLTVRDNGDLYVALRVPSPQGGIVALRDTTGNGKADVIEHFGKEGGTGIGIHQNYLYFGSDSAIYRYKLPETALVPTGSAETVVKDFPVQRQHAAKPFTFDDQDWLYVNVGAPSNACQERMRTRGSAGIDPCPQLQRHGGIWRFKADRLDQTQTANGYRYAGGIRNAVAIDWNPAAQHLYVVQHGRDQLHALWPNLFSIEQSANLPAEEFLLVKEGSNFGWPYCYYDQFQDKKVLAPEYGGDGQKIDRCNQFDDPFMAFPGHWAPNDLLFYTGQQFPDRYRGGAFVAFHGSWNRAPLEQQGYNVVFVPFGTDGRSSTGEKELFADGFSGVEPIESPRDARFRPMGLAQGPDGSLYISDSQRGRIWRVIYTGPQ